jgi:hypothetical protein
VISDRSAALNPELQGVGGIYLAESVIAWPLPFARNTELAAALWSKTEELLKARSYEQAILN